MAIPGVFIAQIVALLLGSLAILAICGLVVLWAIQRFPEATRRVVLQRAIVPVQSQSQAALRSALLPSSMGARAPPTFPSDLADLPNPDPYRS